MRQLKPQKKLFLGGGEPAPQLGLGCKYGCFREKKLNLMCENRHPNHFVKIRENVFENKLKNKLSF